MENKFIKPYGDALDDGLVQLAFTLPVENGAKARKAAQLYVEKLNFESITVAHAQKIANGYTYFVVFARATPSLDYSKVEAKEIEIRKMDFHEINDRIKQYLGRPIYVVGATIGSDAHTVGIDAIMNMKGFNQDYGLERYPEIKVLNLGAQVSSKTLIEKAIEINADAILISQTVTKNEIHIGHLTTFIDLIIERGLKERFILIAGGARITNDLATGLGYDAGFGQGTAPSQVASYLVEKIINRKEE